MIRYLRVETINELRNWRLEVKLSATYSSPVTLEHLNCEAKRDVESLGLYAAFELSPTNPG